MELQLDNEKLLENNLNIEYNQNNFLNNILGRTINGAIDIGLRYILPDLIEEQVIDVKNNLIKFGLKDGIKKSVENALEIGKSVLGITTGNFTNISQVESAIKSGEIINSISKLIDNVLNLSVKKGKINTNILSLIKDGKNTLIHNIEKNIKDTLKKQESIETSLENNINSWKKYYQKKDFDNMEKEFNKIEKEIKKILPVEEKIKEARKIEMLHNLIKNNNKDFNLNQEEIKLLKNLN